MADPLSAVSDPGAFRFLMALLVVTSIPAGLAAQSAPEGSQEPPPQVDRPDFMSNKPYLPEFLLRNKREGWYVTGFPAIGWDDEQGFAVGALAEVFDNGAKDDPFFRSTPYRTKLQLGVQFTSERVGRFIGHLDVPYILDSPYRLRVDTEIVRNPLRNYFGVGNDSMKRLNFPGQPGVGFEEFEDYQRALDQSVGGLTYANFNRWKSKEIPVTVSVERDLFGGLVRPLVGLRVLHIDVDDYTGRTVSADSGRAVEQPTKLLTDFQSGRIIGLDGGWDNAFRVGLTFDTRDFEPNPTEGVLAQIAAELATRWLGSDNTYQQITTVVSGYHTLLDDFGHLVFAGRAMYLMQFGQVPFFAMSILPLNTADVEGLGGFNTIRGFKRKRFVGDSAVVANGELRWSFTEWEVWGQHLRPMLVPFVDAGRAYDGIKLGFDGWKSSYGAGFRLAWNLSTIISFDYAFSDESRIFYLELGQAF
jgi:hypothetical protein